LIRTIAAHGGMIAVGAVASSGCAILPALGDSIYNVACAMRAILDKIDEQRLEWQVAYITRDISP
jgi:hypothetical protein